MKQKLTVYLVLFIFTMAITGIVFSKSLYLNSQLTFVNAYAISPDGSTLTFQVQGTATLYAGVGIALDGEHADPIVFLTFEFSGIVEIMNAATMTYLGQVTAPGAGNLAGIEYDDGNDRVYAVDRYVSKLYVYDWDFNTKTLTGVAGSPFTISAANPYDVSLDQVNNRLYVSNYSTTVNMYDLNDDGDPFSIADAGTINVGANAISLAIDEGLQYLYYGGGSSGGGTPLDNNLYQYNLGTGAENSVAIANNGVVGLDDDQDNHHVYFSTNGEDKLFVYDQNLNKTDEIDSGLDRPTG